MIEKCMRSAIANANEAAEKANVSIDPDDLVGARRRLSIADQPRTGVACVPLRRAGLIASSDTFVM